jgi:hypothetical protein
MKTEKNILGLYFRISRASRLSTLITFILLIQGLDVICQSSPLFCGNRNDDMFLGCNSKNRNILWRITDFGQNIEAVSESPNHDYSEPSEGVLLDHVFTFTKSGDFGENWATISPKRQMVYTVFGGVFPGECLMMAILDTIQNPRAQFYKSYDNGTTLILTKDSATYIASGVMGHSSGEFYTTCSVNGMAKLCRSIDFGFHFDTIPFTGDELKSGGELYRGANSGELFLVTHNTVCPTTYKIYHSDDYGVTWTYKNEDTIDCSDIVHFSSGRGECTFYYVYFRGGVNEFTKIHLYGSTDCGETFTKYDHTLFHTLSIDESGNSVDCIKVNPNPALNSVYMTFKIKQAGNYKMELYSLDGRLIARIFQQNYLPGEQTYLYTNNKLKSGMYFLVLKGVSQPFLSTKIIIQR